MTPSCYASGDIEVTLGGARDSPLDSFYHKAANCRFEGNRYHTLAFRDFVLERLNAAVQVRGINCLGEHFSAAIPCNYRWSPHIRQRNLAVIYSFCDICGELGYDASTVSFLTLTVRHPRKLTYGAASAALKELRRGWQRVTREIRRAGVEYLAVIEPGETGGFPHYHVVLLGASEAFCEALITLWCRTVDALPVGQDYSVVRDIRQTGAYIAKYLTKTLDSDLDWKWLELCYRERLRTWSMTRRLRSRIAAKYHNPTAGLGILGEAQMSWQEHPDPLPRTGEACPSPEGVSPLPRPKAAEREARSQRRRRRSVPFSLSAARRRRRRGGSAAPAARMLLRGQVLI